MSNDFTPENKLMYELIFGNKVEYEIQLMEYISDIKDVKPFMDKVLKNLKKSGIKIQEDVLILTEKKNIWILKRGESK